MPNETLAFVINTVNHYYFSQLYLSFSLLQMDHALDDWKKGYHTIDGNSLNMTSNAEGYNRHLKRLQDFETMVPLRMGKIREGIISDCR